MRVPRFCYNGASDIRKLESAIIYPPIYNLHLEKLWNHGSLTGASYKTE